MNKLRINLIRVYLIGIVAFVLSATVHGGPDSFSEAVRIGPGHAPDMAIDAQRGIVHLIYIEGDSVYYREGDVRGVFGQPERIVEKDPSIAEFGRYWYPRIALDGNGAPHVVFTILKPDLFNGLHSYYSNRIGGEWKKPLAVFSVDEEGDKWVNFPHLVMEDDGDTVYIACKNKKPPVYGEVARIENASRSPRIAATREVGFGGISMLLLDGELYAFGGEHGLWHLFKFDKRSMEPTGDVIDLEEDAKTEQIRAYQDATGDVHFVGATWRGPDESRGFYNSLSRVNEGKPLIRYMTTNGHHCGNGRVVRDARKPDRIYNFHFSGAAGGKHGVYYSFDCEFPNQVHFVRLENGEIRKEHQRIADRSNAHGSSYRLQVAAEPHPQGGALVVYPECGDDGQTLFITLVGECSDPNAFGGQTADSSES